MAVFAGRESVPENTRKIFLRDADPVVRNGDSQDFLVGRRDRDRNALVDSLNVIKRIFGVAEKINDDLQDAVAVYSYRRRRREAALEDDAVALKGADVHRDRVFDELVSLQIFKSAAHFGVALLHGYHFFNVLDVAREQIDLGQDLGVFLHQILTELRQITRDLLPVRIVGEEVTQSVVLVR